MSRGPGRIERAITTAFGAEPKRVFTTEDLCRYVYRHLPRIEKKHRVSLLRAAKRVLEREPNWQMARTHSPGAPLIFFNEAWAKQNPGLEGIIGRVRTRSACGRDVQTPADDELPLDKSTDEVSLI